MSPTLRPPQPCLDVASSFPAHNRLRDGDVLLTYGSGGLWPPRRWLLWVVYHAIRKFQERRWGEDSDTGPTHVRVWLRGQFFEATTPVCRWTSLETAALDKKHWIIVRYRHTLDSVAMLQTAYRLIHTPYDKGDLLDFALSGWLGRAAHVISLFGDRAGKYRVCSTAAAEIVAAGGANFRFPTNQVDPAYFANVTEDWTLVAISPDH